MNTVGLLLVLGLAFFAMKQKVEKTRNMLLVVSALLGFCMFSAEGFTSITFDTGGPAGNTGVTVTTTDQAVYTFPSTFSPASPESLTDWTCPTGKVKTPLGDEELAAAADAVTTLTLDNINSVYPCTDAITPPADQSVTGDAADPCKCLTAVDGNNLYCNSGWMNSDILEYMGSDGKKTDNLEDAHICWPGPIDFIPKLGDLFLGRCTKKAGSGGCDVAVAPAATGGVNS